MKIALGSDHGGFALKEHIKAWLEGQGHQVEDCGCYSTESVDYPVYGRAAAGAVASGRCERGIVVCTTGITDRIVVDGNVLKYDPESCLEDVMRIFTPLVELAEAQNIRLAFELCPMMFNTAISPYMLERIFEKLDSPYLGLTFDPSHLVWQMIDPYPMVEKFSKKLFHVHGKDCEILWEKLRETGILHTIHRFDHPVDNGEGVKEYDNTWYRYRLPGLGELNWARIISDLQVQGFDGTISIEHEDPVWCGSIEKIQKGLIKSRNYLLKYL